MEMTPDEESLDEELADMQGGSAPSIDHSLQCLLTSSDPQSQGS